MPTNPVGFLLAGSYYSTQWNQKSEFGLSALEALACGVPVIATNSGGITEVVKPGETGALCAVGDVDAMARESIAILSDKRRWAAMSAAAATDARARFGLDEIVGQYE